MCFRVAEMPAKMHHLCVVVHLFDVLGRARPEGSRLRSSEQLFQRVRARVLDNQSRPWHSAMCF